MLLQQWNRHKAVLTEPSLRVVWLKRMVIYHIYIYIQCFCFHREYSLILATSDFFCALKVIPWRSFAPAQAPACHLLLWLFLELLKPGSPTNHLYVKGQLPTYAPPFLWLKRKPSKAYRIASWGHSKCSPKKPCKTCNTKGKALGHLGAKTQCDQTLKKSKVGTARKNEKMEAASRPKHWVVCMS